jgi:PST family polysaccharide transporter
MLRLYHFALQAFGAFRLHLSNFSAFTAIQVVSYLIPLVTIPYFARVLTISGMGQLAIANAAGLAGGVIMDYGILQSGTRYAAKHSTDRRMLNQYLTITSFLKILIFSGIILTFAIVAIAVPQVKLHFWVYFWALFSAAISCLFPLWLFQGLLIVPKAAKILVATRFLAAGAAISLIRSPSDTYIVPMTQSLAALISLILAANLINRSLSFRLVRVTVVEIQALAHDNWKLFSATTWGIIHTYGSIIIIGVMLPTQSVGFYSIAERISQAFVSFFNIAAQTTFPTLVRRFARSDERFSSTIKVYLLAVTVISLLALSVAFLARSHIYYFFAGQGSVAGLTVFTIWLFASFFTVICVTLTPVMIAMNRDSNLASIYRFTGITFLITAPFLVYFYGVVGMAVTMFYGLVFVDRSQQISQEDTLLYPGSCLR